MPNFDTSPRGRAARLRRCALIFPLLLAPGCGSGPPGHHDAAVDAAGSDTGTAHDASATSDSSLDGDTLDGGAADRARLVVLGPDGELASLDVTAPFAIRASAELQAAAVSVKCGGLRCAVVHPSPVDSVDIIDALTLGVVRTYSLARGADPRDATWLDDHTVVVTQYESAELVVIDVAAQTTSAVSLAALADADELPEASRIVSCGHHAYVQLARIDHETGAESALGPALAVLDFDQPAAQRVVDVDPDMMGVQGVALASRANFDMPTDCVGARLFVAEPRPLFSGGGEYQVVDLDTFVASTFPFSNGAQVGGFEVVDATLGWRITHTDFGPGASSHLELVGAGLFPTYNTFSGYHVDELALDRVADLLFFPDPCTVTPSNQACQRGVHAFHAHSGERANEDPVDVGFDAIDLAIAR